MVTLNINGTPHEVDVPLAPIEMAWQGKALGEICAQIKGSGAQRRTQPARDRRAHDPRSARRMGVVTRRRPRPCTRHAGSARRADEGLGRHRSGVPGTLMHDVVDAWRKSEERSEPDHGAALVVLAAGGSIRMGQPKQLLPYRGVSLVRHAAMAALASRCRPVCIVLGNGADRLEREIADLPVVIAANRAWATGMASSIRTGLETVLEAAPHSDAVVLMLCDQPLVTPELLDGLVHEWRTTGRSIVACDYGDGRGAPALFARSWFAELARLTGDIGAKAILRTHAAYMALVSFPGGAIDVDSPADYARLAGLITKGAFE